MPPESPLQLKDTLDKAAAYLHERRIEHPRLNAERLLGDILGLSRIELYTNFDRPLAEDELRPFRERLRRRAAREPLEYIIGHTEFYGRRLRTDKRALIPRPETEQLVELTLEIVGRQSGKSAGMKIIEVGTGSGAIAVALAAELDSARVWASDSSADALLLALENARDNHVDNRITFLRGDLFQPFAEARLTQVDLVISNPPYVAETEFDHLAPEIRDHEPRGALAAGADGLDIIRRLIEGAGRFLETGGLLAVEIGFDQGAIVRDLAGKNGRYRAVEIKKDYAGHDRMLFAGRKGRTSNVQRQKSESRKVKKSES